MSCAEQEQGESRLHIDWTRCDGRGVCSELLPEVLGRDDWGYPLTHDHRDPVVGPNRTAAARDAVELCPRLALRLDRMRRG
ncbi:ferredoxin [Nocardia jiangxiensis]|uniref:Ferredoxin n=1 Tax=Nocardia jiangxiensis TaxID=282685 RepID=A0ABW6S7S4_9NOCA